MINKESPIGCVAMGSDVATSTYVILNTCNDYEVDKRSNDQWINSVKLEITNVYVTDTIYKLIVIINIINNNINNTLISITHLFFVYRENNSNIRSCVCCIRML